MSLSLFRERTFVLAELISFIVGYALFGEVTFLPLYLQVVKGTTPSQAGLQITPMMAGVLFSSIVSGRVISRIGKYRLFPIAGTALVTVAMLLSTLALDTPLPVMQAYMALLGLGLGMVMQVLVLAVQNVVEFRLIGVATSSATLFRSIGWSVGVAAFGAIFSNSLHTSLEALLPPGAQMPPSLGPQAVAHLPAALHDGYPHAFAASMQAIYLVAAGGAQSRSGCPGC